MTDKPRVDPKQMEGGKPIKLLPTDQVQLHRFTHALIVGFMLIMGLVSGVAHTRLQQIEDAAQVVCQEIEAAE